jgi:hypothetical protein
MSAQCQSRPNALQQKAPLFDHLVGECEQFIPHQAERFGGLAVGGQLDGKIGRLGTLTLACGSIFQRGLRLAAPR